VAPSSDLPENLHTPARQRVRRGPRSVGPVGGGRIGESFTALRTAVGGVRRTCHLGIDGRPTRPGLNITFHPNQQPSGARDLTCDALGAQEGARPSDLVSCRSG
jgi:hypothetical protein